MPQSELSGILEFLRAAERLKTVTRTAWTSEGTRESVAAHTWRLSLMALVLGRRLEGVDRGRLLELCVVHDLGEAIGGDVPAIAQDPDAPKAEAERRDLETLTAPLPADLRATILALWDEYDSARSPEARTAKALDKLETILQHTQGRNPADFDYRFNLGYGREHTAGLPLLAAVREILDRETEARAREAERRG